MASRETIEKRKSEGLCVVCGQVNDLVPKTRCSSCSKRHSDYMKEYNKSTKGKELGKKFKKSTKGRECIRRYNASPKAREASKRKRLKYTEEGKCSKCGRPKLAGETTKLCINCNEGVFRLSF